ncbi:hypothetical protein FLK61_37395 [Paenalkalicoccus suaedae]|uniref:Uncharacterized protein n=1 Tax=Paenalkalicoccus suaedae TaxID=2592382 RepID=A0A859FI36_9BACI|nr:hypothetical protein [Paenalkalicoccus suaedae]QKS72312.1 hypothetical protein FLK61_37395 [Paenalkalicoccus suaedae]
MDERRQFLLQQLEWVKKQQELFGEVEQKLVELRVLANEIGNATCDEQIAELRMEMEERKEELASLYEAMDSPTY